MCSLSSTECKRTRRWLPCIEKICSDLKNTGAPLTTSPSARVRNREFGSRSSSIRFRSSSHRSVSASSRLPLARFHGFSLGAVGVPGLGFLHQMSPITFRFAVLSSWMYRWVIESEECPAISWTSRSDPPASVIFFAMAVMKVLLPE